jgi:CubicO group peptidase (beta-lactamase class C family)
MHFRNYILVLSIHFLLTSMTVAQTPAAQANPAQIDEYLTRMTGFGFSGGVLIGRDRHVLLEKGYGASDRKRNIPVTKDTAFDIGSNTKDFTKMAILQLVQVKKLDPGDALPRFLDNVPVDKARITVAQLLDHTAGFGMYSGRDDEKVTKEEFLRRVLTAPLISPPGKQENYSNPGYGLLAAIIEKVSGQSFEQYLNDHIFKPAGMLATGYLIPRWRDGQLAHSYSNGEDRGSTFNVPHLPDGISWSLRGAGGTLSTLGDMYRFHLALEGELLLSKDLKSKLFDMEGPINLVGGNGIHYFVYIREPASHLAVLIASTDAAVRATEVDEQILALVKGKKVVLPPSTIKVDSSVLAKFAGSYKLPSGAEVTIAVRGDSLFVAAANQEGFDLLAGAQRGNPEQITKMNSQVREILEAGAKGDHTLLHKAFGAAMPFEEFKPRQEALWGTRKEQLGQFKGVTILGTVLGQGNYVTTARLDFERGSDYAQFMWGGGMLRGIRPSTSAPGSQFFAQTNTEFVSFKPTSAESIGLVFRPDEKGQGFRLSVRAIESPASVPDGKKDRVSSTLPDTPPGRVAAAYLKAFNSGDEKAMTEFFVNHLSKTSLASRTMEERLKIFHRMRDDLGELQVEGISDATEQGLTLSMKVRDDGTLELRFEMDAAEPARLKALRVERR